MASIPRIMVVDTSNRLGDLVRAAMAMLDRRYIMVEIPTPQEALDEVFRTEIDLAVTAYMLDGTMSGTEWAERAIREQAGAQIIVAASDNDPKLEPAKLKTMPFQYIAYTAGEHFLRAIRIGLDGQEVVEAEEGQSAVALDLGPIPTLDIDHARGVLLEAIREIGAIGGLISDRAGRIVVDEGATGYIDKTQMTALFGPTFAQAVKVAPQVGGNGWSLKYYEGDRYNLFTLAAGYHYFMLFLVESSDKLAFGAVTRYGRQGAKRIIDILGDKAWAYADIQAVATEMAAPIEAVVVATMPEVIPPRVVEQPITDTAELASKLFEEKLEPIADLDLDALFGQAQDDAAFGDLFSEEALTGDDLLLTDDNTVSYEEAQDMGLLGD